VIAQAGGMQKNKWRKIKDMKDKTKKQLVISQIILAVGVVIATLILIRPGSNFDINENWFTFFLIILLPNIYIATTSATLVKKSDDDDERESH